MLQRVAKPVRDRYPSRPDMAAEAPALTHCPNCGAQLKRADLSLCAYCAMPLAMGGRAAVADDETTQRLKRMREHPSFPAAQAFVPPDSEVERAVVVRRNRGLAIAVVGGLWFASALAIQGCTSGIDFRSPWLWVGDALAFTGALVIVSATRARARAGGGKPLLVRPAIVAERRSETNLEGRWGARTVYFFTLRFDDGSEGEFKWPGQGLSNEPMTNGQTGIAYTRGEGLVAFRKLA
jgi:hypothetical protein